MGGLGDTGGDLGDDHVHSDGEEGSENGGKAVLGATVLGDANDLLDEPTDEIHPRHSSREGEPRDDRVERLGLEFLSNKVNSLKSLGGHVRHSV